VRSLHCRGEASLDRMGNVIRLHGTVQDVTAIRRTSEGIQRRREFERAVLDSMTEMVLACDADGKVTMFNRAMSTALGLGASAIALARWEDLCSLHHPDGTPIAAEQDPIRRALRGERVRELEVVIAPASQAG